MLTGSFWHARRDHPNMLPQTADEIGKAVKDCRRMATRAALRSAVVGALPVPWIDAAIDVKILAGLISRINERFGLSKGQLEHYREELRIAVFDLIKRTGARFVGRYVTREMLLPALRRMGMRVATKRAARYIPVLGTGISAAVSFGAMKLAAHSHIKECAEVARRLTEQNIIDVSGQGKTGGRERIPSKQSIPKQHLPGGL
jgi:hypothetical protein